MIDLAAKHKKLKNGRHPKVVTALAPAKIKYKTDYLIFDLPSHPGLRLSGNIGAAALAGVASPASVVSAGPQCYDWGVSGPKF